MKLIELLLTLFVVSYFIISNETNKNVVVNDDNIKDESITVKEENIVLDEWFLVSENVEATVYNAVPEQCDSDCLYTASMFRLNLNNVYSHRIIAMERTFIKYLGLKYGDVVKVEGTGEYDGVWQIQDTMNKKYAGRQKIDFLVPNNIKTGKWENIKLYVLTNKENTDIYKYNMAPQAKI
jgi:hypothetical protein